MNIITRLQIEDICDHLDLTYDEGVHYDYSGRYMYGEECVGFVVERGQESAVGGALLAAMVQNIDDEDERESVTYEVIQLLRQGCTDNMALDVIVYFPNLKFAESESVSS